MNWDYRIMRRTTITHDYTDIIDGIHEVYYEKDGTVSSWTADAVEIMSEPGDMEEELKHVCKALEKPILDYETGKEITVNNN